MKLTACAIYFTFYFGLVIRYINDEHTAKHRDPARVKWNIGAYIDPADMDQISCILAKGCTTQLQFELPQDQKMRMLRRCNQKSILDNQEEIWKTTNKKEKHCHIIPFLPFVYKFGNMAQCVLQGMISKIGSDPSIVWDGSTKLEAEYVVMNDSVSLELEAPITVRRANTKYTTHIYNTCVSYPKQASTLPPQT